MAKTLEICDELYPGVPWFLENPATGLLVNRGVIEGRDSRLVSYCRYARGDEPGWQKHTRIWCDADWYQPRPPCSGRARCAHWDAEHKVHPRHVTFGGRGKEASTLAQRYAIPRALVEELISQWPGSPREASAPELSTPSPPGHRPHLRQRSSRASGVWKR